MKTSTVRCPVCQAENQRVRKFCRECGAKLVKVCSHCGLENHLRDKLCGECGQLFSALSSSPGPKPPSPEISFDERLARIQRYLPGGLTQKILARKDKIEGEHKQVTVMFCDMVGFTVLSEKLGHEEVYLLLDQILEILIHKVHDYEGTVNKMTGDGIMALFGAPIALEDGPQRAIHSALAISKEMTRLSEQLKEEKGIPAIQMRIGIHTGPVVVGTLGNDLRVEFSAVGDTVNLASRMEAMAEPGSIYVSEDTYRLTEGFFWFESLGEKKIKGKEKPIRVFRVIAPSKNKTRFEVYAERGLTPFVGRKGELEFLLDCWERAKGGRGQVLSVVGEAGLGKSRLLYEFRKAVANEDLTFLEGRCLSYGRGLAYHPFIPILKTILELREGEEEGEIREKVKGKLKSLRMDEEIHLPYLLELLSIRESGIERITLSPEAKKDQIIGTLKLLVMKKSGDRPLVLVCEDLQWMDRSSGDALRAFLEMIPGGKALFLFTYRPDFAPPWRNRSYHSQITLSPLSKKESLNMVSHLLGTNSPDRRLGEWVLGKTEGIPFFLEEFVRSLKDLKVIVKKDQGYQLAPRGQTVTTPSTIQDVIMARVDSLPEGARELLRIASVIDREFNLDLIRLVSALPQGEFLSSLAVLKNSEMIYEKGIPPHSSYIFKHALTRDMVYDSILTGRKKILHTQIAQAMEEVHRNRLDEYAGVLAEHFLKSENYEKGAEYARMAGKRARARSAYSDAISYTYKELFCLENLAQTAAVQEKIIEARVALAKYCMNLNDHVEAYEAVSPIADLALRLNYQRGLPSIYTAIGSYLLFVEEDFPQGRDYLSRALEESEKVKDFFSMWNACYLMGTTLSWNCDFKRALEYFQKSLHLSKRANNLLGISSSQINMAVNYLFQGKVDQALNISRDSLRIAEQSGDVYMMGMAHSCYGTAVYYQGLFDWAQEHLNRGISICEKSDHLTWGSWALAFLGDLHFDLGEYGKSIAAYEKASHFLKKNRFGPSWLNLIEVAMARAKVAHQQSDINLEQILKSFSLNKNRGFAGWIAQYIAEILFHLDGGYIPKAQDWVEKAIEVDRENGMRLLLGRDYLLYGRICKRKGEVGKSKENLMLAIEILRECGAGGFMKKAEQELALLDSAPPPS